MWCSLRGGYASIINRIGNVSVSGTQAPRPDLRPVLHRVYPRTRCPERGSMPPADLQFICPACGVVWVKRGLWSEKTVQKRKREETRDEDSPWQQYPRSVFPSTSSYYRILICSWEGRQQTLALMQPLCKRMSFKMGTQVNCTAFIRTALRNTNRETSTLTILLSSPRGL